MLALGREEQGTAQIRPQNAALKGGATKAKSPQGAPNRRALGYKNSRSNSLGMTGIGKEHSQGPPMLG